VREWQQLSPVEGRAMDYDRTEIATSYDQARALMPSWEEDKAQLTFRLREGVRQTI